MLVLLHQQGQHPVFDSPCYAQHSPRSRGWKVAFAKGHKPVALISPNPHFGSKAPAGPPGTALWVRNNAFTPAGSSVPLRWSNNATKPVMKGVAMLVPCIMRIPGATTNFGSTEESADKHDASQLPGAVISGFCAPVRNGP